MANLPRFGRTWNRFSSLPRPGSAGPQPFSEVQPTASEAEYSSFAPPTTQISRPYETNLRPRISSLPTSPVREYSRLPSPVRKLPSPPPSPKYRPFTSSPPKPAPLSPTPTYSRYNGERRTTPTSSPRAFKPIKTSPPLSPKYKQPAAPLSPLTLPRLEPKPIAGSTIRSRSPPEVEQKSILTAEKTTKYDRQSEYSYAKPHQNQNQTQTQTEKQKEHEYINIRGENVGAVMHITQASDGTEIVKKKPSLGSTLENDERKTSGKDGKDGKANKLNSLPAKSFLNSNFQGVNNSILYNSSFSHRDPGVHLGFSKKPSQGESAAHDSRH